MDSFRTMRGRCVLTDGEIRLESSLVGYFRRLYEGSKLRFLRQLGAFSFGGYAVVDLIRGDDWRLLALGLGLWILFALFGTSHNRIRGRSTADRIPLSAVESVEAVPKSKWFSRPRFLVLFRRNGERLWRRVSLPSRKLSYTMETYQRGKQRFRDRGIAVEERER